jgi:endonuclease/exonuclease/phosphatase family metal-dependent hydrolase
MDDWTDAPQRQTTDRLTPVPLDLRQDLRRSAFDRSGHDQWFDSLPCLREIEVAGGAPRRGACDIAAKVVFWNVERLRYLGDIAEILQGLAPDVMLLCEIDRGMARSGNTDRVVDLAGQLNTSYAYAVEFVELDLGDIHEKRDHAGELNGDGLHGAAILTDVQMGEPFLIRIDRRGDWFGLDREEPRVGGRIALGAMIDIAGVSVAMVNAHLESHDDPEARAGDMARLLGQIDQIVQGGPVILGGDFNTSTASRSERQDPDWHKVIAADPMRMLRPDGYEPLFGVAAHHGYDWQKCNLPDQPTTRYPAGSSRIPAKIDWFFTRGLIVSDPKIIPALRKDGSPASDHEGLMVTVHPI